MTVSRSVLFFAGVALLAVCAALWWSVHVHQVITNELTTRISAEETAMHKMVDTLDSGVVTGVAPAVVTDCSSGQKGQYYKLLGNLSKLNHSELTALNTLFPLCSRYEPAESRLLVWQLQQKLDSYQKDIQLLAIVRPRLSTSYQVETWNNIVSDQVKRADYDSQLVGAQQSIISALLSGESQTSEQVIGYIKQANDIKHSLSTISAELRQLESKLQGT